MKKNHFIFLYIIIIALILVIIVTRKDWLSDGNTTVIHTSTITNFDECANAGYPIQESYPRRCAVPQGQTFTEKISTPITPSVTPDTSHDNIIKVTEPQLNQSITSPVTIKGIARGNWYFEASFPIVILDANDKVLAEVPAQAQGEWMTNDFVPFEAIVSFPKPTTTNGKIILKKDNPSGMPENEDQIEIPVLFFANGVGR